jgi:Icc-related predicted phosphoesterase
MLIADYVHPFVYRESFPEGVPEVAAVLAAGDLPGHYLEFVATKLSAPVLYVHGNHDNERLREGAVWRDPQGVIAVHGRVVEAVGLVVAGWGGVPKYREDGDGQFTEAQARWGFGKLSRQLLLRRLAGKRQLDILLTHAPPLGEHAGSDHAHRGCPAMTRFALAQKPALLVHGHIHEYEGKKFETRLGSTRVINAYGYRIVELEIP